jgi:hypothetical protein
MHQGSCLCGAVKFEVSCALPGPDACHCTQCRKHSGHYGVGCDVPKSAVKIEGENSITWFKSSEKVRRGFCKTCGSSLFFDPLFPPVRGEPWIGIAMGAFDGPTSTKIALHIFMAEKGDYYDVNDDAPQYERIPTK